MASQRTKGYRIRNGAIQIWFIEKGETKRTYKTLDTTLYPNTGPGINAARALREKIKFEIKHGLYDPANYWEEDRIAASGLFAVWAQKWLDSPENDWVFNTRRKYKGLLKTKWMPYFHAWDMAIIEYSDLLDALIDMNAAEHSESYYNDILTVMRGVFDLYCKANGGKNPTQYLSNKTRVSEEPDPFTMEEASMIIQEAYKHDEGEWFQLGFFTGMRCPGEMLGLQPTDFVGNQLHVKRQRLHNGKIQAHTKNRKARTLNLNYIAKQAVESRISKIKDNDNEDKFLFDFKSNRRPQRILKTILKDLKIRPRPMYNMRHSFACYCIMEGQLPAYIASQLGHSLEEFFKTYAKWINQIADDKQIRILDAAINNNKHIAALKAKPKVVVDNTGGKRD